MNVLNFSLATLVRLFRNIKNTKNYTFFIYASNSLELRGIYLLVIANSPKDCDIKERFKACFCLSSHITVGIRDVDILIEVDDILLEILITMSLKESDNCSLIVRKENKQYFIYANDVELITTIPVTDNPSDYVGLFPTIGNVLNKDDFNVVELPLQIVLDSIATMPFDCHNLAIQIVNDEVSIAIVNENATRLVLLKEPIDYPCEPDIVYSFCFYNLKYLHDICGHLLLEHSLPFLSNSVTSSNLSTYLLGIEYTSFALRKKEKYSDTVVIDMGTMTYETYNVSEYETYRQVLERDYSAAYEFVLNTNYISKLYKKAKDVTSNRIQFLDISGASYIDCRDVSWLNRLVKKYGELEIEVSGIYKNVMKATLPTLGDIYFTIYREAEKDEPHVD